MYGLIVGIRNYLYDKQWIKPVKAAYPIISIGNIGSGGSGKTPFAIMLAEYLHGMGYRSDLLSSGYGRSSKGELVVYKHGKIQCGVKQAGDELMVHAMSDKYNAVIASKPKYKYYKKINNITIVDDGFQHRKLYRDLDIVLLSGKDLYGRQIPWGLLREKPMALRRADIIAITDTTNPGEIASFIKQDALCLHVQGKAGRVYLLESLFDIQKIYPENVGQITIAAGIANPERFKQAAEEQGYAIKAATFLADHIAYNQQLCSSLIAKAKAARCQYILVTEKDAVKLFEFKELFAEHSIQCIVLPWRMQIRNRQQEFIDKLQSCLTLNKPLNSLKKQ
jgi:tetraacyldisaccharide 4'-kinase